MKQQSKRREQLGRLNYPGAHPELYYRLQSDVAQACDELDRAGVKMLTAEVVAQTTDRIHDSVCRRYPDLVREAQRYEDGFVAATQEFLTVYGIKIQQRGFFRDLIAFLLLGEFFRRRRRRRY